MMRKRKDTAVVVFAVPEATLRASMRTATGPCVPTADHQPALCSPLEQHGGEEPRTTAALYAVLTGRSASEALEPVDEDGPGRLFVCSRPFVEAMANMNAELQSLGDEDDAAGDRLLPRFTARLDELDRAWLAAGRWPEHFLGVRNRLAPRLGRATEAITSGHPLWCWYGPSVPQFVVVQGSGPYRGR
jgi:hypothetical protein